MIVITEQGHFNLESAMDEGNHIKITQFTDKGVWVSNPLSYTGNELDSLKVGGQLLLKMTGEEILSAGRITHFV